ncbi:hypothetical protein RBSWK_03401 [Rhodopirellula baltica SWK14]|uniref:Uncharacterized protein n=1 Tax=Rhodopirellula baltica SWK14 TaxID=993516 RepID=L7CHU9_RHOBT|nr:hypothetical protein RBSWK_03401 [Rhodopirellula baltica SWK14]
MRLKAGSSVWGLRTIKTIGFTGLRYCEIDAVKFHPLSSIEA